MKFPYFQALIEACFIHGINKKFSKISKKNGKEIHQINIWPIIEAITSQADQKSLKLENKLLQTKTGLARAAIRTFLNNQVNQLKIVLNLKYLIFIWHIFKVLDCYVQALLLDNPLLNKFYDPWALLRDPDHSEVLKNSLQGLENLKFAFSTNSPVLDTWSRRTLELATVRNNKKNRFYFLFFFAQNFNLFESCSYCSDAWEKISKYWKSD